MSKYTNLKKFINDPNFDIIQKHYKQKALDLNHFFPLNFNTYKNKGNEISGLYYHITDKMLNTITNINSLNVKFKNNKNVLNNIDHVINQNMEKILESKAYGNEIRYSNLIESKTIDVIKKRKLIDVSSLFSKITSLEELINQIKNIQEINDIDDYLLIRNGEIGVFETGQNTAIYNAIDYKLIEQYLEKLTIKIANVNTIIDAIFTHIIFELIHPLVDGNGRFGRYFSFKFTCI